MGEAGDQYSFRPRSPTRTSTTISSTTVRPYLEAVLRTKGGKLGFELQFKAFRALKCGCVPAGRILAGEALEGGRRVRRVRHAR